MDTITHALSGALLAMATAPGRGPSVVQHMVAEKLLLRLSPKGRLRAPHFRHPWRSREQPPDATRPGAPSRRAWITAGAAAAAFPDSDFVLRAVDTLTYLTLHQGVTHSLVLLPVWAWLLALLFAALSRQRYRWPAFYGIAALGIAIHIGGDLVTAYGTQIFAPFSDQRFSWPLLFVIDPWVTAILVAGLALASRGRPRQLASLAFVVLAGYLGLAASQQQRAIGIGADHARAHGLDEAVTHALAQPLSPFHWLVIVQRGDHYHIARINLARDRHEHRTPATSFLGQLADGYAPVHAPVWTRHARYGVAAEDTTVARAAHAHDSFVGFRRFARFLVLDHIETRGDRQCVWFSDLRFSLPVLPPSFRYGLCRGDNETDWRLTRLHGAFTLD